MSLISQMINSSISTHPDISSLFLPLMLRIIILYLIVAYSINYSMFVSFLQYMIHIQEEIGRLDIRNYLVIYMILTPIHRRTINILYTGERIRTFQGLMTILRAVLLFILSSAA